MNYKTRIKVFGALAVPLLLFFSACFGGGATVKGQEMRFFSVEPKTALLPGMVRDEGGTQIVGDIFAGLVTYDREANLINEVAESITTEDNLTYTIKLKRDWKFTNGEKVTAKSFVDAWNFEANLSNAQSNRDQLQYIDGYSEDLKGDLSGLKIIDDYTFTVKLNRKLNDFTERLTDVSFYPLPSVAYKDIKAFGKNPIGNGQFILKSHRRDVSWSYKPNPDFRGYASRFPVPPVVTYKIYKDGSAAYADYMAGELDYVRVPREALSTYKKDSEGRYIFGISSGTAYIVITDTTPGFEMNTEAGKLRRKALSLAINRKELTDKLYDGTRYPADGIFSSGFFPQYANLPATKSIQYNPEKAKELWAEVEKLSPYPTATLDFYYNQDGDHKEWIDAVVNQLKNNLGITNILPKPVPSFREYLRIVESKTYKGFGRLTWNTGFELSPSIETVFTSTGSNNVSRYSNPELDKLAEEAVSIEKSKSEEVYKKIFTILLNDLPLIPVYGFNDPRVYAKDIKGLRKNKRGMIDTYDMVREEAVK